MLFQSRNSGTFFAITVLLLCLLQNAPGAKAICDSKQLIEKAGKICGLFIIRPPYCDTAIKSVLETFISTCLCSDGETTAANTAVTQPKLTTTG